MRGLTTIQSYISPKLTTFVVSSIFSSCSFVWGKAPFTVMDDKAFIFSTHTRLRTLRALSYGLETLAVRSIVKNVRFYLDSDDRLEQLKSLPGVLREKILQTLMMRKNIDDNGKTEEIYDLVGIFPFLLSSRTRYIELNGIMSFVCPGRFKTKRYMDQEGTEVTTLKKATECCVKLLEWIELLAPKVETLIIKQNNPFAKSRVEVMTPVSPKMLQLLMKMQNLKTLRVDMYCFKKNQLLKISRKLPNLHQLHVPTIDSSYLAPKVFTDSFCNVKELIFANAELSDQHDPENEVDELKFHWRRRNNRRSIPKISCQRCQQHVFAHLAGNELRLEEFQEFPVLFPNISCLTAKLDKQNEILEAASLPQFDHITQLNLLFSFGESDSIILERFLKKYGRNLQTLYLSCENFLRNDFKIDMATILKFCPKLEKLSLNRICLITSTLPIEFFTELKQLEWILTDIRYGGVLTTYENDAMILSNILSAPKLEKVVLEGARFNKEDLIGLNTLIQQKKILSQLHTFHFYLNTNANENFEDLTNLLKSACAYLPKLSELKVGRQGDFQDPFVTCAIRKDDRIFDECMRSLLYLLEFQ